MKTMVWSLLIISGIILFVMFYPSQVIIVVKYSYFDLAMGAFSGGNWSSQRIGLMSLLVISALIFMASIAWLIIKRKKS